MSCGVSCRHGSDLAWMWVWRRPGAAALIRPLAWEPPYATGAALEKAKRQKVTKRKWNQSLALLSGLRIWHCQKYSVGGRGELNHEMLWLWCRLAAIALIRPLAWEPPYATGAALEKAKRPHTHTHKY